MLEKMEACLREIEVELPNMEWTFALENGLDSFVGRGAKWAVHLVSMRGTRRMAVASAAAGTIIKLTDGLAEQAEQLARARL